MKKGQKMVLKWFKENHEAIEKFKRNAKLQEKLWAKLIKEEKNNDTKMVLSRNERYTLSDRCGNS